MYYHVKNTASIAVIAGSKYRLNMDKESNTNLIIPPRTIDLSTYRLAKETEREWDGIPCERHFSARSVVVVVL